MNSEKLPGRYLTLERLQTLTDGVIAIVITLLVLTIEVPPRSDLNETQLNRLLMQNWLQFVGYILSFTLVGIYWLMHHTIFHYIRSGDRTLTWLCLIFLMFIAFIPFPTGLLVEYPEEIITILIYGGAHTICGLSLAAIWFYATSGRRLVSPRIDPLVVRSIRFRLIAGPTLYITSMVLALVADEIALLLYVITPVIYILPRFTDSHWAELTDEND